jgi:hypothetical protein
MQDITPFELYILNRLELDIKVKQGSIGEWDEDILIQGNDALVDNGKTHLYGDQK